LAAGICVVICLVFILETVGRLPSVNAQGNSTQQPTAALAQITPSSDRDLTATALAMPPDGTQAHSHLNPCTNAPFHTVMTGAGIQSAHAGLNSIGNQWVVNFTLAQNQEAQDFSNHTKTHIGQPLAIVLNGQVISAPTIQAELTTGGQIVGNFTETSAKNLALQLKSGALPISLHVVSVNTDPSSNTSRILLATDDAEAAADLVDQDRQIVERRLDDLGISPVSVQVLGGGQFAVQIPAVNDLQSVVDTIQQTGLLEFVDFSPSGQCSTPMPQSGQYILTDKQITLKGKMATPVPTSGQIG